jgi:hypothetical protein
LIKEFEMLSIADIIRRERHDPPMTDEERQRAMDFIAEQTAKNSVAIDKVLESHRRAENRLGLTEHRLDRDEYRLDRDERVLKLMLRAGRRGRRDFNQRFAKVAEALKALAEAQARTEASIRHTDERLDALVDIVRTKTNGRS